MTSSSLIWLAVIALLLWRMYARIRRLVGRQRSVLRRHIATLIVFPLLTVLLALSALRHPLSLAGLAGGFKLTAIPSKESADNGIETSRP